MYDPHIEIVESNLKEIKKTFGCLVSVDCVIFGYDHSSLKVLVINCNQEPFVGKYSVLGDLVHTHETMDEAIKRVLSQRAGLEDIYMEEVKVFSSLDRHPMDRVITIAYYSLVKIDEYKLVDAQNKDLKWIEISEAKDMAFDHEAIVKASHKRLQDRIKEKPVGFNLLPEKFTLNQLQLLYENILGITLDKRNFRRKLNNNNLVIDLGEVQDDVSHRPAKLYKFDFDSYQKMKKRGQFSFII